jgi:hypothetical protein
VDARRAPLTVALAAAVVLGTTGCGPTATVGSSRILRIALGEYRVTPQDVHVKTGLLTIYVHNYGRLTHDLVISFNGQAEMSTGPLAPGQSGEIDAALIPGAYEMSSSVLSDQALGAYGTLDAGS